MSCLCVCLSNLSMDLYTARCAAVAAALAVTGGHRQWQAHSWHAIPQSARQKPRAWRPRECRPRPIQWLVTFSSCGSDETR